MSARTNEALGNAIISFSEAKKCLLSAYDIAAMEGGFALENRIKLYDLAFGCDRIIHKAIKLQKAILPSPRGRLR